MDQILIVPYQLQRLVVAKLVSLGTVIQQIVPDISNRCYVASAIFRKLKVTTLKAT